MKLETKPFRTKIGRRIFMLFILCAMVPIATLALVSYVQVKGQLLEQCRIRINRESRTVGVSIFERLSLIRTEMNILASNLTFTRSAVSETLAPHRDDNLQERFRSLILITAQGRVLPLLGSIDSPPVLSPAEKQHLGAGKVLLTYRRDADGISSHLFMLVALDPEARGTGTLLGEINAPYLWKATEGLPPGAEVSILDRSGTIFFSSIPKLNSRDARVFRDVHFGHAGYFTWSHNAINYFADYWTLFLKPNFFFPELLIVISESEDDVYAPVAHFKQAFPAVMIISLGVVFFLSSMLIRRNMTPIEVLNEATQEIARGGFGHTVEIKTGDEFEDLAASFNNMSQKIKEGQSLLVKAAKLSTLGQISAGIIHEIKQPLFAIHGLLELSLRDETAADKRKRLETAMQSVKRLDATLGRFKSFSHMSAGTMAAVSLNTAMDEVISLMEHHLMMHKILLHVEGEENLPLIAGEKQGLQQVFSNLLLNAVDALETSDDRQRLLNIKFRSSESRVFVEIRDNGCGIPEDIQKKIFDPFFTTKPPDRGTGLGMAIVESILHKHNATLEIKSTVGKGTGFIIAFPALSAFSSPDAESAGTLPV